MEKKIFETPSLEVDIFDVNNVISTSTYNADDYEQGGDEEEFPL